MTQIKNISPKEMLRRTGVNALGYTYPDKDTILLRKGLTGKLKKKVLDHEINHLKRGEEGPFIGALVGGGASLLGSYLGGRSASKSAGKDRAAQERMYQQAMGYLSPYREFGGEELGSFRDWLGSEEGQYRDPTMDEVMSSPGYETRLGAIENSAAARGGLLSGNALRDIGEFGASEYDRTRDRRVQDYGREYDRRLGRVSLGQQAAGGTANILTSSIPGISNTYSRQGNAMQNMYGGMGSAVAGTAGAIEGENMWNKYLDRAYPR